MTSGADGIIGLYQRHARAWAADRGKALVEKPWLDRFLALLPARPSILDLGCGSADPLARYLVGAGCRVTGVDASPEMIAMCRDKFPGQDWRVGDMRELPTAECFDGLLAWDSFFHLSPEDQHGMFARFRALTSTGSALMYTSGTERGVAMGSYRGEPLYHASLDTSEYRSLLAASGFEVVAHAVEDPACGGRTVWLARRT